MGICHFKKQNTCLACWETGNHQPSHINSVLWSSNKVGQQIKSKSNICTSPKYLYRSVPKRPKRSKSILRNCEKVARDPCLLLSLSLVPKALHVTTLWWSPNWKLLMRCLCWFYLWAKAVDLAPEMCKRIISCASKRKEKITYNPLNHGFCIYCTSKRKRSVITP